jgi:hypothetical protein
MSQRQRSVPERQPGTASRVGGAMRDDEGMPSLSQRVVDAAQHVLGQSRSVSPVDVFCRIGWLTQNHLDHWQRGRTEYLEPLRSLRPQNLESAMEALQRWAQEQGLQPSETAYVSATRDRRPLLFVGGDEAVERALRTHWISGELSDAQRERIVERQSAPPDLLVISPVRDWTCTGCAREDGDLMVLEDGEPLCLTCADLDTLVFLPAGDATLTRRAKRASGLSAVVVRWSRSRKRYERKGILVEEAALQQAEASCLADEEVRRRQRERDRERRERQDVELTARMAEEIARLFPACPRPRAEAIAAHTSLRGSGRVGRSAAGRALAADALVNAVVASVRHEDTDYDKLLMSGVARDEARARVRDAVDAVLDRWRSVG